MERRFKGRESAVTSAWIVARPSPGDRFLPPGYAFEVQGDEVPDYLREGRVILPATGGTYDPEEYPELAEALARVCLPPGQLPDFRAVVVQTNREEGK